MQKKSYDALKYTRYSKYNVINVWAKDGAREQVIKQKLLTDKNFKLTSLQVNPLYKPIFDKLEAQAAKELAVLDKSYLWSRRYTKEDFKEKFAIPAFVYVIGLFLILQYGLRYRIYLQFVKHGRRSELADSFDIDLDDVESYPASVFEEYTEKKKKENSLKRKEEEIKKVENRFHKFAEKRVTDLAQRRRNRGLNIDGANSEKIVPVKKQKKRPPATDDA